MLWAQKETKAWFETSDIEGRTAIYDPHLNVRFKVNRVFVRSRMMCLSKVSCTLGWPWIFLLKAMVFTFTLEKKIIWNVNFLKREINVHCLRQIQVSENMPVHMHCSTCIIISHRNSNILLVYLIDIGKAIQIRGEWTWSKSYRYICIRSIDFFTCLFEANCNAY